MATQPQHTYQKVPNSLRHWRCTSCDLLNPLFDTRCMACFRLQEFNDKSKLHLIELCKTFCSKSLLSWHTIPSRAFKIEPLTQALSNKLYKVEVNAASCKKGVLRIFNHRIGLTLEQLLSVYKSFADSGIGAGVLGAFDIGQIEEFIEGHCLNDDKLIHNPQLSGNVAEILSKIHQFHPKCFNPTQSDMVSKLTANIKVIATIFDHQIKRLSAVHKWDFVLQHTTRHKTLNGETFAAIMQNELRGLIQTIEADDSSCSEIVFSHNDYHSGNMILENNEETEEIKADSDSEGSIVKIIDYEYAGYNYRSFDFGNFFNELMIDNYYKDAPYFKIDEANYPSADYRRRFVSAYLGELVAEDPAVHRDTISAMMKQVEYGSMLSHLWWAMWGIIESQRNDIDWDYMEYARQRLSHFFRVKLEVQGE